MNIIETLNAEEMDKRTSDAGIPDFQAGDTVRVNVKVVEGGRERIQAFEGVCIGRKNAGVNSSFRVRKISYGEGVERVFPLYSPRIDSIEIIRRGKVRRSKLYYLRGRTGKAARITERKTGRGFASAAAMPASELKAQVAAPIPEGSEENAAETTAESQGEQQG